MPPDATPSPLSVGAVIQLRRRLWRVDQVGDLTFSATPLDGRDLRRWTFHRDFERPTPARVDDPRPDQLGQDPAAQDLYLRALRLRMIHAGAPFLGLQRSRATPQPYQLVPLLMALQLDRVRLLIGDDVGVGKTIEAGLILAELLARGQASRVLVVVPAALRDQWQDTLDRFFHVDAEIIRGETRAALERRLLPGQSPWSAFPVIITSLDYAKLHRAELLHHRWDLAIFDEAHLCARPHVGDRQSEPDMMRWQFLRELAPKVRHLLLLSATPHNGYPEPWASLISTLDPALVRGDHMVNREAARDHIVQRRRRDLERWYGAEPPFPRPDKPREEIIELSKAEQTLMSALRSYTRLLQEQRTPGAPWLALHLERRLLSSPDAFLKTISRRLEGGAFADGSATPRRNREAEDTILDLDTETDDEERYAHLDTLPIGIPNEREILEQLKTLAAAIRVTDDGKLQHLLRLLPSLLFRHSSAARRVLIFTRYKDTVIWLKDALERHAKKKGKDGKPNQLASLKVVAITGELPHVARKERYREFQQADLAVCVATDCISEGLDLQRGCAELVHYELPWNPNRLEQRNGRINRYGQTEKSVGFSMLVRHDPLDVAVLEGIIRKTEQIRRDHGFCPALFSGSSDLRKLILNFGRQSRQLSLFDRQTFPDLIDQGRLERIRDESFYGQEAVRLPDIERALTETYARVGNSVEISTFVSRALAILGIPQRDLGDGRLEIEVAGTALKDLAPSAGGALIGTFSAEVGLRDPDLPVFTLAHPLLRRLVEEVLGQRGERQAGRFAARGCAEVDEFVAVVHLLVRFVAATAPPTLMEELIPVLVPVYGDAPPAGDPERLMRTVARPILHQYSELTEAAVELLANPLLSSLTHAAVQARMQDLRHRQDSVSGLGARWGEGAARVEVASVDRVAITLLVPAGG